MSQTYPRFLIWTDIETTGLPVGNDFSGVEVLEVAIIVTDFDLTPKVGYEEIVTMTPLIAERIRANPFVKEMHGKSGLLVDAVAAAREGKNVTLADIENEILDILGEMGDADSFMIAGSGVAAFDYPLIKAKMPTLAQWLAYYPIDIGIMRRSGKILAGREFVSHTAQSYGEAKVHRAMADVRAHLEEAGKYRQVFREAFNPESLVQS